MDVAVALHDAEGIGYLRWLATAVDVYEGCACGICVDVDWSEWMTAQTLAAWADRILTSRGE